MGGAHDWRLPPERPSVTPAFVFGLVLWVSCALVYTNARQADLEFCLHIGLTTAASALVSAGGFAAKHIPRTIVVAAIALFMGASIAAFGSHAVKESANGLSQASHVQCTVELEEDSVATATGERACARVMEGSSRVLMLAYFEADEGPFFQGERLSIEATVVPADYSKSDYLWKRGAAASLCISSCKPVEDASPLGKLRSLRKSVLESFDGEVVAERVLAAIVCGYRHDMLGTEEYRSFQVCGLAHLVAVSGAHLVIVTGMVIVLLRTMGVVRQMIVPVAVAFMGAYLVLSGLPASAVRAAIMSSVGLLSLFGKRRPSALNALGIGMCFMVACDIPVSVSASFCLSCLSTAGIVLFAPLMGYFLGRTPIGRIPALCEPLSVTLAAGLLSQLYATSLFGLLPLASPIANIVCAPLFPLVCGLGIVSALVCAVGLPIAGAVRFAADASATALYAVVEALAALPYASIPFDLSTAAALCASCTLAIALWFSWTKTNVRVLGGVLAAAIVALAVWIHADSLRDEIIMLDVGQGDSILLRSRGRTLLVDTGNQDTLLASALGRHHVYHLDGVLVTHADDDHCGSLDALGASVEVDCALLAKDMISCDDESCQNVVDLSGRVAGKVVGLSVGDVIEVGSFSCEAVWPYRYQDAGGNADSLCLLVVYDGDDDGSADATALLTGDVESDQLSCMMDNQHISHIDVLKVGHHGSRNGITLDQAERLSPTVALIGVGANNRYGHPSEDVLEILDQVGCAVFRTDEDGDVSCTLSAEGLTVRTMK